MRWEDARSEKISQTTIINGNSEQGHRLAIGFAIHELIIHMVKNFKDISPRIYILTLRTNGFPIVLMLMHQPKKKTMRKNEGFMLH